MNSKEINREQIRKDVDQEWNRGKVESLFEAAEQRMIDKIVRGGYLSRRDGAEYADEFREKLLEEGGLKLFASIENQIDESMMLFFKVELMDDKVMQVVRTDDKEWQARLVNKDKNSFGAPVIEAEKLDENLLCVERFRVEPDYDKKMYYNWVKRDGEKRFEWKLIWSKKWRDINEDKEFKKRLIELSEEIEIFKDAQEVDGY